MPCGWVPGMPTHETIERDMRESALYEAHELLDWITDQVPSLLEYVPPDLDYIGKMCAVIDNLGEDRFKAFMIDNLDDPKASHCLHWWSKHKEDDAKRTEQKMRRRKEKERDNKLLALNNTFKDMSTEQLDKVINALRQIKT